MFEKKSVELPKMPPQLSTKILARALGESDLARLWEMYQGARQYATGREMAEPTEEEVKIVNLYLTGKSKREVAAALGVSRSAVGNAVSRVAVWRMKNGK